MISQLIHNIYLASLYSTLFAILFIIFRKTLVKLFGARWSYYLWFVVFIPWFAVWLPLHFFPDIDNKLNFHVLTRPLSIQQDLHQVSFHSRLYLSNIIFMIWIFGALLYSAYILLKHFRFISLLKESTQLLTVDQQAIVKKILAKDLISIKRIYLSTAITSPMICHVIKSKIYLPANFFQYFTSSEQKYILQHECVHYQRCDLIANTAMLILICLNWFNPVILFSYRYFRCAQELSCDSILSYQFSSFEKKAYGYALLKSVLQPSLEISTMTCWWNSGKQLKERCFMLKYHHSKPINNFFGLLALAVATSVAIAAPNLEKWDVNEDLKIANHSKNDLSFSVDNICSDKIGVINAHSVKVVPRRHINRACQTNPTQCVTEVYATPNCSGSSIVTLIFDVAGWGVMGIKPHCDDYHVGVSGFNLFFVGPWV